METAVYRKPATTDCIFPNDSCHPTQHKISGIRYLVNRMLDYLLPNNKKKEEKVNQTVLRNNHYHDNIINTIQQKTKKQCQKMNYDVHSHKEKKKMGHFDICRRL